MHLFEASWEVCNKVGGIYTVVMSKAGLIKEKYDNYFLVGPYVERKAMSCFEERDVPPALVPIFDELKNQGIVCHYGVWQIESEPQAILIDAAGLSHRKDEFKKFFWDHFQIDSLFSNWDFEEPMMWSVAVGMLLQKYAEKNKDVIGHFHEWLAGFALLYLKRHGSKVGTIFTTHATMLGRSICGSGQDLYDMLDHLDPDSKARDLGVYDKFSTERACAKNATVFTTVSEVTGLEAQKILGRKPDVLLLNGLDIGKFPSFEETSVEHRQFRDKMREFIAYFFFPYYYFDLEESLNFFIVGRYEFKNKGIDVLIDALSKLNYEMKVENAKKNVVVFFWIPIGAHGAKVNISANKLNYHHIKSFIRQNMTQLEGNIIRNIITTDFKGIDRFSVDVTDKEFLRDAKQLKLNFNKEGLPPICTHNLPNENDELIIRRLREVGLNNLAEDRVKVVVYPVYLTGVDGLLDLSYYDAISACHLGIFPSYYEPWGYTPLEAAALGVPAITTDLSGYGKFLEQKKEGKKGVFVLKRYKQKYDKIVEDLKVMMKNYQNLDQHGRVEEKLKAKEIATLADWKVLVKNYFKAHKLASKA